MSSHWHPDEHKEASCSDASRRAPWSGGDREPETACLGDHDSGGTRCQLRRGVRTERLQRGDLSSGVWTRGGRVGRASGGPHMEWLNTGHWEGTAAFLPSSGYVGSPGEEPKTSSRTENLHTMSCVEIEYSIIRVIRSRSDSCRAYPIARLARKISRLLPGSSCGVEPTLRRDAFRHGGVTGIDAFPEDVYIYHLGFGESFFGLHIHPF
jgi:hypothetical protein